MCGGGRLWNWCSFLQRLVGCGARVQQRNGSALFSGWVLIQRALTTQPRSPAVRRRRFFNPYSGFIISKWNNCHMTITCSKTGSIKYLSIYLSIYQNTMGSLIVTSLLCSGVSYVDQESQKHIECTVCTHTHTPSTEENFRGPQWRTQCISMHGSN